MAEKWVAVKGTVNTCINMCGHEKMNEAADANQMIQLALISICINEPAWINIIIHVEISVS